MALLEAQLNRFHSRTICLNGHQHEDFGRAVIHGLTAMPKRLPCRFLYDREGSLLFEEICEQPEYYLTRTEGSILDQHADDIVATTPEGTVLVELGSGTSTKTRTLIRAFLRRSQGMLYAPIDISPTILAASAKQLRCDFTNLATWAITADYHDGLDLIHREVHSPKLVVWLGSSIGNLGRREAIRFLRRIRRQMGPDDHLLLGADLLKDRGLLEAAYDDAFGVTARFNKNLLERINRELSGDFDLEGFAHRAIFNQTESRVEMHLASKRRQRARIDALELDVPFQPGETIHTENSYKYSLDAIVAITASAGLRLARQWMDSQRLFCVNLLATS